jgi:tetratricopeptide (TPR) repeat protein
VVKEPPSETACPRPTIARDAGLAALVLCATFAAYIPALGGGFIWNDSDYVTAPALRSFRGLGRIWTEVGSTQQYYPLLHSAFWVQHLFFGDRPLGYHIVTVALHALSAVLFALVLRRLFRAAPSLPAGTEWLAALLFAMHPVNVESVAWISEQKNTASLALYLASALAYLRFDETRRPGSYAAALALFACSLLCKTVTATLPAALLVALWWRRGRLGMRRDVAPLVPWLALGAAAGLFSSWVERRYIGAQGAGFDLSWAARVLVAGRAVWFYVGKLAWPSGLNFVYPRWTVDTADGPQWLFPLGVVASGALLWSLRSRSRGPIAAFLFFTGSLFPALGFVNLYGERYSWVWDHWQYLPDLGLIALAAAGLGAAWRRAGPKLGAPGMGLAAAVLALLGALTWAHCGMFHDDETLYRESITGNPGCWFAHNNLGIVLAGKPGRMGDAIAQYEEAIRFNPDYAEAHNNLGTALAVLPGRLEDAMAQYREAIRINPDFAEAHNNLGNALVKLPGRSGEAAAQYGEAIRINPDFAEAHNNLGTLLSGIPGRSNDAIAHLAEAIRIKPDYAEAHLNLGNILSGLPGRSAEAVAQFEEAIRINPGYAEAHNNLGTLLSSIPGKSVDAIAQYREAIRADPDYAAAHFNLGNALRTTPDGMESAVAQYEEAIRINPGYAEAHANLGTALAGIPGHLDGAIAQYEEAIRLRPDVAAIHLDLAIALMQAPGRDSEAEAQLEAALRLQPNLELAGRLLGQLRGSRP